MTDMIGDRRHLNTRLIGQQSGQGIRIPPPFGYPARKFCQLSPADGRLHFGHAPIGAKTVVQVAKATLRRGAEEFVGILAVILISPGPFPVRFVPQQRHAAFPTRRHDLVRAEGESSRVPQRSCHLAMQAGPMRLGAILDQHQIFRFTEGPDFIQGRALTEEVHHDHRARLRRQALFQRVGGQVEGAGVDVGEDRRGAGIRDRLRGGEEGERRQHHLVAGGDSRGHQREVQRVGAGVAADGMRRADEGAELALQRLAFGPEHVASRGQHAADRGVDLGFQRAVLRRRIHHGDGSVHPNFCSLSLTSRPTSRASFSARVPPSPSTPAGCFFTIENTNCSVWTASASPA